MTNEPRFVSDETLGKAAYSGCYAQYGHNGGAKTLDEAWDWIGPEQRRMWMACAKATVEKLQQTLNA